MNKLMQKILCVMLSSLMVLSSNLCLAQTKVVKNNDAIIKKLNQLSGKEEQKYTYSSDVSSQPNVSNILDQDKKWKEWGIEKLPLLAAIAAYPLVRAYVMRVKNIKTGLNEINDIVASTAHAQQALSSQKPFINQIKNQVDDIEKVITEMNKAFRNSKSTASSVDDLARLFGQFEDGYKNLHKMIHLSPEAQQLEALVHSLNEVSPTSSQLKMPALQSWDEVSRTVSRRVNALGANAKFTAVHGELSTSATNLSRQLVTQKMIVRAVPQGMKDTSILVRELQDIESTAAKALKPGISGGKKFIIAAVVLIGTAVVAYGIHKYGQKYKQAKTDEQQRNIEYMLSVKEAEYNLKIDTVSKFTVKSLIDIWNDKNTFKGDGFYNMFEQDCPFSDYENDVLLLKEVEALVVLSLTELEKLKEQDSKFLDIRFKDIFIGNLFMYVANFRPDSDGKTLVEKYPSIDFNVVFEETKDIFTLLLGREIEDNFNTTTIQSDKEDAEFFIDIFGTGNI